MHEIICPMCGKLLWDWESFRQHMEMERILREQLERLERKL
jgi:hypothetical protein